MTRKSREAGRGSVAPRLGAWLVVGLMVFTVAALLTATRPAAAAGESTGAAADGPGAAQADQQPTPAPTVLTGKLWPKRPGCDGNSDATLSECGTGDFYYVRAGGRDLSSYTWGTVKLQGNVRRCGLDRYIELTSPDILRLPSCGGAPEPKTNLSWKAAVVPSTEQPGLEAKHVTDGDPTSYWYTPSASAWLYIDLGQSATFNESRLLWTNQSFAVQYGIYIWDEAASPPGWVFIKGKHDGSSDDTVNFARTYARYVLLHLTGSSKVEGGFGLREWQIFGVSSPNLALGAQMTASSNAADARFAVDADKRTGWASDAGSDRSYPWIRVHFPTRTPLTEFSVLWDGNAMAPAYWAGFYEGKEVTLWSERLRSRNPSQRLSWLEPVGSDAFIIMTDGIAPSGSVKLLELELYGPNAGIHLSLDASGELAVSADHGAGADSLPFGRGGRPWGSFPDFTTADGVSVDVGYGAPPVDVPVLDVVSREIEGAADAP